jgi:hypothetical protein
MGNSGQGADSPSSPGTAVGARTVIWEGHVEYRARGFDLRGLYAQATIDDAADLNQLAALTGTASIGHKLRGWYLQAGYDLLRGPGSGQQLIPFVRYEELNTQDQVPAGYAADPANDRSILSLGAAWKPLANIAFKGDYQIWKNQAKTGVNQLNVNVGYLF